MPLEEADFAKMEELFNALQIHVDAEKSKAASKNALQKANSLMELMRKDPDTFTDVLNLFEQSFGEGVAENPDFSSFRFLACQGLAFKLAEKRASHVAKEQATDGVVSGPATASFTLRGPDKTKEAAKLKGAGAANQLLKEIEALEERLGQEGADQEVARFLESPTLQAIELQRDELKAGDNAMKRLVGKGRDKLSRVVGAEHLARKKTEAYRPFKEALVLLKDSNEPKASSLAKVKEGLKVYQTYLLTGELPEQMQMSDQELEKLNPFEYGADFIDRSPMFHEIISDAWRQKTNERDRLSGSGTELRGELLTGDSRPFTAGEKILAKYVSSAERLQRGASGIGEVALTGFKGPTDKSKVDETKARELMAGVIQLHREVLKETYKSGGYGTLYDRAKKVRPQMLDILKHEIEANFASIKQGTKFSVSRFTGKEEKEILKNAVVKAIEDLKRAPNDTSNLEKLDAAMAKYQKYLMKDPLKQRQKTMLKADKKARFASPFGKPK